MREVLKGEMVENGNFLVSGMYQDKDAFATVWEAWSKHTFNPHLVVSVNIHMCMYTGLCR